MVREHLILELNDHVPVVTGVPPHIEQLHQLEELKKHCIEIKAAVNSFNETLQESILNAMAEKVKEIEGINAVTLGACIRELDGILLAHLDKMSVREQEGSKLCVAVEDVEASQAPIVQMVNEFYCMGQYWCVPDNFYLPKDSKCLNGS